MALGNLKLDVVASERNPADTLTKPLPGVSSFPRLLFRTPFLGASAGASSFPPHPFRVLPLSGFFPFHKTLCGCFHSFLTFFRVLHSFPTLFFRFYHSVCTFFFGLVSSFPTLFPVTFPLSGVSSFPFIVGFPFSHLLLWVSPYFLFFWFFIFPLFSGFPFSHPFRVFSFSFSSFPLRMFPLSGAPASISRFHPSSGVPLPTPFSCFLFPPLFWCFFIPPLFGCFLFERDRLLAISTLASFFFFRLRPISTSANSISANFWMLNFWSTKGGTP